MNYSNSKIVQGAVFLLAVLLTACGGGATDDGKNTPGNPAPTVSSTSPANLATGVAPNAAITATFSAPVNVSSVSSTTFTLSNGATGNAIGNVSCDGTIATFTPSPTSPLTSGTTYTATISTGVTSVAGTAMASPYTWTFTTGTVQDTTPPTVSPTSPASGATDVATNATIIATFSENMTASTVTAPGNFTLKNSTTNANILGTVAYSGTTATFTPLSRLTNSTAYTATISQNVRDAADNAMTNDRTWSFTTGAAADTTPPTVSSTSPATGATNVSVNAAITATFSEDMNASTVTKPGNFTLSAGSTAVPGTVTYNNRIATFAPTSGTLANGILYTATITTSVQDLATNAMASDRTWSFTTGNGAVSTNGWLYTKPNDTKIYVNNGSGEQVWVGRGVNVDDLLLGGYNFNYDAQAPDFKMTTASAEQALKDLTSTLVSQWKPNFIRVNLSMYSYKAVSWLTNPAEYRTPMENVINALLAQPNVYVLVTLRSDASMATCAQGAATLWQGNDAVCVPTAATDAVYQALVDSFGDKPNVLFGVSNEPGGGANTDDELRAAMSRAVDVIRTREDALGFQHHIVAVQGNDWTSRIDFYHTTPLTQDKVVYEYHSYPPISNCDTNTDCYGWNNIPIIIGEYGGPNRMGMSQSAANTFFADVESRQMSTLAWSFSPYNDIAPDLLTVTHSGTNIQPSAWGNIVKAYLLSHAP